MASTLKCEVMTLQTPDLFRGVPSGPSLGGPGPLTAACPRIRGPQGRVLKNQFLGLPACPAHIVKLNKFLEVDCCLSLGLNPKRNRFGWLCRLGRRGVGEKC